MKLFDWLLALRPRAEHPHVQELTTEADAQALEAWCVVNQSRAARGEPPLHPHHFRPRDLIDPRPEDDGA